eukprot:scaffold7030_cov73-Isochrysis_galbana.AAC.1
MQRTSSRRIETYLFRYAQDVLLPASFWLRFTPPPVFIGRASSRLLLIKIHPASGRASSRLLLIQNPPPLRYSQDVLLPAQHLIGEPGGATVCMMRNLEIERVVLAAMGVRPARQALHCAGSILSPPGT